ncbi:MAG: YfcE family phosphodiesterase, partial [Gammaproteobacteria bacterium]|nr:YfcE family phosphodiesterase [Gammaproteobacteria bacterium]
GLKDDYLALYEKLNQIFKETDLIIHAGDVTNINFIKSLEYIAPVEVVCGNMDDYSIQNKYDSFKILNLGRKIGISHQLPSNSFLEQNNIDIMIHGHSHRPEICENQGILFLNPGSVSLPKSPPVKKSSIITYKKRPAVPTVIILNIEEELISAFILSFKVS